MKDIKSSKKVNLTNAELEALIKREINSNIVNKQNLRAFEKVNKFAILKDGFNIENGLMSMTQKVKRNKVFEKYDDLIKTLYK